MALLFITPDKETKIIEYLKLLAFIKKEVACNDQYFKESSIDLLNRKRSTYFLPQEQDITDSSLCHI